MIKKADRFDDRNNCKGDEFMIVCSVSCVYQADGVCMLDRAASAGKPINDNGCIHYVPRTDIPNAEPMNAGKK
jgi:hypothetical protein